jgi:hypothetical protein
VPLTVNDLTAPRAEVTVVGFLVLHKRACPLMPQHRAQRSKSPIPLRSKKHYATYLQYCTVATRIDLLQEEPFYRILYNTPLSHTFSLRRWLDVASGVTMGAVLLLLQPFTPWCDRLSNTATSYTDRIVSYNGKRASARAYK